MESAVSGPNSRNTERRNDDIERDTGRDEPHRESDTDRTVGPEDEDRRVRPGEKRPAGTMP